MSDWVSGYKSGYAAAMRQVQRLREAEVDAQVVKGVQEAEQEQIEAMARFYSRRGLCDLVQERYHDRRQTRGRLLPDTRR